MRTAQRVCDGCTRCVRVLAGVGVGRAAQLATERRCGREGRAFPHHVGPAEGGACYPEGAPRIQWHVRLRRMLMRVRPTRAWRAQIRARRRGAAQRGAGCATAAISGARG